MADIATFLQDLQRQRGLSLRGLAREVGISASTLSRWRSGKQVPSPKACKILADKLALSNVHMLALAGHLKSYHKVDTETLPEFREYVKLKYPKDLDDDMVTMIEALINRKKRKRERRNGRHG